MSKPPAALSLALLLHAGCLTGSPECDSAAATTVWYADGDGDGYGSPTSTTGCLQPSGYASNSQDCDDNNSGVYPDAAERCDGLDQDCDGEVDDGLAVGVWYSDSDGDGYGDPATEQQVCDGMTGMADNGLDCDDGDSSVNVDLTWHQDADGDGAGDPAVQVQACAAPSGYVANSDDCDDSDPLLHPDAVWYADFDGDGWGRDDATTTQCAAPVGYVDVGGDCDDADPSVSPGESEVCGDGIDNDCDGGGGACVLVDGSLADADGRYAGVDGGDAAGFSVASAGDVDGDGFPDLAVGAPTSSEAFVSAGAVYLVRGGGSFGEVDLADAAARYTGPGPDTFTGFSIAGAGDVDGDGFGDLLIGGVGDSTGGLYAGAAYLVLGSASPAGRSLNDADARYTGGADGDYAGVSVAGAGDVNGDGLDDLLVGAPYVDAGGIQAGAAYLLLGSVGPGDLALASAHASYQGEEANDEAGGAVAAAGDVDGDGLADVLIGAAVSGGGAAYAGAAYLLLGTASPADLLLADADARYLGAVYGDSAGASVAGAGDVDGDGFADLLIGAPSNDDRGLNAGVACLFLGSSAPAGASLAAADACHGGAAAGDMAGTSLAGAGDLDGDGFADVVVGAPANSDAGAGAGAVYVVLGSSAPVGVELGAAAARWLGEAAGDGAGASLAGVGDLDRDGFDDVLIGAPGNDSGRSDGGAAYLVLGTGW